MILQKVTYRAAGFFRRLGGAPQKGEKNELTTQHNKSKAFKVSSLFQEGKELKRYNRGVGDSEQKRQRQQKTKTNNIK